MNWLIGTWLNIVFNWTEKKTKDQEYTVVLK